MEEEDMLIHVEFLRIMALYLKWKRTERIRRWRVQPVNLDRATNGYFHRVFKKIKSMDEEEFFIHTRMTRSVYDSLLGMMSPYLQKSRQVIGVEERLSITLLYLAHGSSFQTIAWSYKMGKTTIRNIILETCESFWNVLSPVFLRQPTQSQYKDIASNFNNIWNMPNCVGAIDGKHVAIACPKKSSTVFLNYKKFYSIVVMATCSAKYIFTSVNIGTGGSQSDGGILKKSAFGRNLLANTLPLPADGPLPNGPNELFPFFFVGEAAFPLKTNLMRPYPGQQLPEKKDVFNYRLSRARRTIENSFGILTARWRVLKSVIECSPENAEKIILACLVLHNFIMLKDEKRWYCPQKYDDYENAEHKVLKGGWQMELADLGGPLYSITTAYRNASGRAFHTRDRLAHYFLNGGAVPFQYGKNGDPLQITT